MPPCNKCNSSTAQEGDSWCLGCSSLEVSQGLLKQPWRLAGLRAVAEEALLSFARLVRAFANLDQSLGSQSAGGSDRAPGLTLAPKPKVATPQRSRSPARDTGPPLPRSPARPPREDQRREEAEPSDYEFEEGGEEEEEEP